MSIDYVTYPIKVTLFVRIVSGTLYGGKILMNKKASRNWRARKYNGYEDYYWKIEKRVFFFFWKGVALVDMDTPLEDVQFILDKTITRGGDNFLPWHKAPPRIITPTKSG